jgi:hypothetical protein
MQIVEIAVRDISRMAGEFARNAGLLVPNDGLASDLTGRRRR